MNTRFARSPLAIAGLLLAGPPILLLVLGLGLAVAVDQPAEDATISLVAEPSPAPVPPPDDINDPEPLPEDEREPEAAETATSDTSDEPEETAAPDPTGSPKPVDANTATMFTPEGFEAIAERNAPFGEGRRRTFSVEVEAGLGIHPTHFATEVEFALYDRSGWTRRGEWSFQRVAPKDAQTRILLASPETVDTYCGRAGLQTEGRYSCWTGEFAMINAERWQEGASAFQGSLTAYHAYLVNHELGHSLGYLHVDCPAPGTLAPVMMQQSISTGGCLANPWPYPATS